MDSKNKTIVVTGVAGYIGGQIALQLKSTFDTAAHHVYQHSAQTKVWLQIIKPPKLVVLDGDA